MCISETIGMTHTDNDTHRYQEHKQKSSNPIDSSSSVTTTRRIQINQIILDSDKPI